MGAAPTMDLEQYDLRDLTTTAPEQYVEMHNRMHPDSSYSVDLIRQGWAMDEEGPVRPPYPRLGVHERASGRLVAALIFYRNPFQEDPTHPWFVIEVDREFRRRGLGAYLYDRAVGEARQRGATGFRSTVRDDEGDAITFLTRRGFTERRRSWVSAVDVRRADTSRLPNLVRELADQGIEVTTLAKEGPTDPAVLRRAYEVGLATDGDVPRLGGYTPVSYEQFLRVEASGALFRPEAWFVAKQGDRYVGESTAYSHAAQPRTLMQSYTGTRPEFRRRRIAEALKLTMIEYARDAGFDSIETSNDSLNTPMWSLNERLGFRKLRTRVHFQRDDLGAG
jgi:ribosomal protein S18 acetylase RimI-like enzyme